MSNAGNESRHGAPAAARIARTALPWLVTALLFAWLFRRWDLHRVAATLAGARWGLFLALMAPYSLAYFVLDTAAIATALRRFHEPVRFRDLLPVRAVTYVLALLNSNVGQGGLALWLNRREGLPLLPLAGTFLFLAFVEIYQLVLYSSIGVALAGTRVPDLGRAYAVLYTLLAAWLVYFVGLRAAGVSRPAPGLLATFGRATLLDYLVILAIKSVALGLAILVHWRALGLFGIAVPLDALLANLPLIFLASAVPLSAGKLHASVAWAYLLGGYAPEESLGAYSLAAHLTFLVMNALIGVAFLPRAGREIEAMARERADEAAAGPGGG